MDRDEAIASHDLECAELEAALQSRALNRLGHLAYLMLVAGQVAIAADHDVGFVVRTGGEVLWVYVGWKLRMSSVWGWCALFAAVDLAAYVVRSLSGAGGPGTQA